jgi:hypothetical protein
MQLVEFHHRQWLRKLLQLQAVEVLGTAARFLQQGRHGALRDLANIGRGLDRAPMHQAFHDLHDRLLGQFGVLEERALALAEAMPATAAVQPPDFLVFANPLAHAQVASPKTIEIRAILVGTGERRTRTA